MGFFQNLSIAKKLAASFSLLIAITIVMAIVLFTSLNDIKTADEESEAGRALGTAYQQYQKAFLKQREGLSFYLLTGDRVGLAQYNDMAPITNNHYQTLSGLAAGKPALDGLVKEMAGAYKTWSEKFASQQITLMRNYLTVNQARAIEVSGEPRQVIEQFESAAEKLDGQLAAIVKATLEVKQAALSRVTIVVVVSIIVLVIAAVFFALILTRGIAGPIGRITGAMSALADGEENISIVDDQRSDEVGQMANALSQLAIVSLDALALKTALDSAHANVIMIDNDHKVSFVNKACGNLIAQHADEVLSALPNFPAKEPIGADYDLMHNNDKLRKGSLENLSAGTVTRSVIGGMTVENIVTPVISSRGTRLGTVVQIDNLTEQLAIQEEVASVVEAAVAGDFSKRLEVDGKTGFFEQISLGINRLVEIVETGLGEAVSVMSAMASGDLSKRMVNDYQGSFDRLKQDSNQMADKLSSIVNDVVNAADSVKLAASEISQGSTDLASRTEEQASSLEEVAAAMEELTATVQQNARNAKQGTSLAENASTTADRGGQVVRDAVEAMDKITSSAEEISNIVGMIDEIAFQTNLLALNAAVEAARAGEAGKGFAVVAQEVRSLAQRSGEASKEIKDLIGNSNQQVEAGASLVNKAGETLEEIVEAARKVSSIISEISSASQEQASGLDEINASVAQMDEMTQHNAALVEETNAASDSMDDQAQTLVDTLGFFKVGGPAVGSGMQEVETAS